MSTDIYQSQKRLERKVSKIKQDKSISAHNRKTIFEFQNHCTAEGIGNARVLRYLNDLPKLAVLLQKDFNNATKKDIENVLSAIEKTEYSPRTKLDFKVTVKKFYKWINGGEEYPECVRWIKTGEKKNNHKLPEELLLEEEIKKMIKVASHPRDRAIISVLWETGCRIGELVPLKIKHIAFDMDITRIQLVGKTGPRRIPLIDSTPYLAEWLNNHPHQDNPDAPLWVGIGTVGRDKQLTYASIRKMLSQAARKAEIKKKVNPHNFRHSRATYLANHLTEAQMNQYLGWVRGSDMPATYVHLSGRDMDDAILKLKGIKQKENKVESELTPKKCSRCALINKATSKYCSRCGAVLDLETAMVMQEEAKDMDDKFAQLLQDEETQKFLIKKMVELDIK
jgi:site-specific recombinase XerD